MADTGVNTQTDFFSMQFKMRKRAKIEARKCTEMFEIISHTPPMQPSFFLNSNKDSLRSDTTSLGFSGMCKDVLGLSFDKLTAREPPGAVVKKEKDQD